MGFESEDMVIVAVLMGTLGLCIGYLVWYVIGRKQPSPDRFGTYVAINREGNAFPPSRSDNPSRTWSRLLAYHRQSDPTYRMQELKDAGWIVRQVED